jgi:hypothetical protein
MTGTDDKAAVSEEPPVKFRSREEAKEAFDRLFRTHETTSQELLDVGKKLDKLIELLLSEQVAPPPAPVPTPAPVTPGPPLAPIPVASSIPSFKIFLPAPAVAASVPLAAVAAAPAAIASPTTSQSASSLATPVPAPPLDLASKFPAHESLTPEPVPATVVPAIPLVVSSLPSCSSDSFAVAPPGPAQVSFVKKTAYRSRPSSHPYVVPSRLHHPSIALLPL